jgi:hypothetical protein
MMKGRNLLASARPLARWHIIMVGAVLMLAAALLALLPASHAAVFTYTNPSCTGFAVSGSPPSQTVTCLTSGGAGVPVCAPTVTPSSPMAVGQSATVTANCSNAPTSYLWTGGGCAGNGATGTCQITKARAATIVVTVAGINGAGTGSSGQVQVVWQ